MIGVSLIRWNLKPEMTFRRLNNMTVEECQPFDFIARFRTNISFVRASSTPTNYLSLFRHSCASVFTQGRESVFDRPALNMEVDFKNNFVDFQNVNRDAFLSRLSVCYDSRTMICAATILLKFCCVLAPVITSHHNNIFNECVSLITEFSSLTADPHEKQMERELAEL